MKTWVKSQNLTIVKHFGNVNLCVIINKYLDISIDLSL